MKNPYDLSNYIQPEPPEYVDCELCETGSWKIGIICGIIGGMIGALLVGLSVLLWRWVV